MLTLLEQLDNGVLWRIPGGIHPPEQKVLSNQTAISKLPLDKYYYVPVPQVGEQAIMAVSIGEKVLKGQRLTKGVTAQHLPVHAPTSGIIKAIEPCASNHPSGLPVNTCVIEADGEDHWIELIPAKLDELTDREIVERVQSAGVAGMGGAAFPSHIKLNPTTDIKLVIINGAECEPYITSDDRLMREHSDKILSGVAIIQRLLSPQRIIIAVEDNKPEAVAALNKAVTQCNLPAGLVRVTVIPTKYPSGGEKQLIQILTGKEVPSGAIPLELGILVHNVGTCYAISEAVHQGKPLIERVVTVTGNSIKHPSNYWLPIGTSIEHVLKSCGTAARPEAEVIIGGPMMGYSLPQLQVPILKGTNCILAPSAQEMAFNTPEKSCIRCSECAQACPANLLPQQLYWYAKSEDFDKAASYNLRDCIECGCCSYVCPSDIPLVEYFRIAKSGLKLAAEEKLKSERAKQHFEAKQQRLEQEKLAREAKAKEAAARRQTSMSSGEKNAIAEAMARIQAKKAAQANAVSSENQANTNQSSKAVDNKAPDDKAAKVAAAIARAKAKKAAQNNATDPTPAVTTQSSVETSEVKKPEDQKAKVAAAIARAKAKKAALKAEQQEISAPQSETNTVNESAESSPAEDDKKARIAAAVARAKAKKLALQAAMSSEAETASSETTNETNDHEPVNSPAEDDKKARIAAAVARAKAKKAARQQEQDKE